MQQNPPLLPVNPFHLTRAFTTALTAGPRTSCPGGFSHGFPFFDPRRRNRSCRARSL